MAYWRGVGDKACLTCQYWTGERELEFSCRKPYRVVTEQCNAKCQCRKSNTSMCYTCRDWRKWIELP